MSIIIIADENIPLNVIYGLRQEGYEIYSIFEFTPGISDIKITEIAQNKKGYILTYDKDFGELVFKDKAVVLGVILLRIKPINIEYILTKIKKVLEIIKSNSEYNFIVVDDDKVRLRIIKY